MTLEAGDKLMSLTDVSEMLGIPLHTLYRWRYKGRPSRLSRGPSRAMPATGCLTLVGVRVHLPEVNAAELRRLVTAAWRHRAPKQLQAAQK
jgi:hypothetical protein